MKKYIILLICFISKFLFSQPKPEVLPDYLMIDFGKNPPYEIIIKNKINNESERLIKGCYRQSYSSISVDYQADICVNSNQKIDGLLSFHYPKENYKILILLNQSLAKRQQEFKNGKLVQTTESVYQDSVIISTIKDDKDLLKMKVLSYHTKQDSGKILRKTYHQNGKLKHLLDEIKNIEELYDENGIITDRVQFDPKDKNNIWITKFKEGRESIAYNDRNYYFASKKEQYDENGDLAIKEYRENKWNIAENYKHGKLTSIKKTNSNEGKEIEEFYNENKLTSKEISTYKLGQYRNTDIFDHKDLLVGKRTETVENGFIYYRKYDSKGKLLKEEKFKYSMKEKPLMVDPNKGTEK